MKPYPHQCPNCRKPTVRLVVGEYSADVEHDGRAYSLTISDLPVQTCSACCHRTLDRDSSNRVTEALRKAAGLLSPEQIRASRTKLALTQKQLAERLQIGEATLSRWETGAQIQQRAFDQMLKLYFALPEVRNYLEPTAVSQSI